MGNEKETRERIIQQTIDLLGEVSNLDKITVREVARRANVGVGLINYHFRTRDNLLSIAIGKVMAKLATEMADEEFVTESIPIDQIRNMLKSLYSFAKKQEKLVQFLLIQGIVNGDRDAGLYLVPLLKELFGSQKDEIQLRIIALQILLPLQVASINPEAFHHFSGIDLHNVRQRETYIDSLVDHMVSGLNIN